jgi:transcriptional regulator with XRE-family HTH domain
VKLARALVDISQPTLAKEAGISEQTLRRMERPEAAPIGGRVTTLRAVLVALGQHGVIFTPNGVAKKTKPRHKAGGLATRRQRPSGRSIVKNSIALISSPSTRQIDQR